MTTPPSPPINPFSPPCLIVSCLASAALITVFWASYGMGSSADEPGKTSFMTSSSWISLGMCMALLAVGIIKFVD